MGAIKPICDDLSLLVLEAAAEAGGLSVPNDAVQPLPTFPPVLTLACFPRLALSRPHPLVLPPLDRPPLNENAHGPAPPRTCVAQAYNGPIPSMVPGQPPLPETGVSGSGGGTFLRPVPSPLGPKGFKPPTLAQLYAAVSSPEQRGWLDALQVCVCRVLLEGLDLAQRRRGLGRRGRGRSAAVWSYGPRRLSASRERGRGRGRGRSCLSQRPSFRVGALSKGRSMLRLPFVLRRRFIPFCCSSRPESASAWVGKVGKVGKEQGARAGCGCA